MFNFTGQDINTANGALFGIRFADTNDSGAPQLGVFSNVTAQSVAESNSGYTSLQAYYQDGWVSPNTMGDITTVQGAYDYMGETVLPLTSIGEGNLLGEIDLLSDADALAAGLDFAQFGAADVETHTLRFDRSLLPAGDFIATLLMECANDGIALLSRFSPQDNDAQDVPEPGMMLGLLAVRLLINRSRESTPETHRSNRPGPDESL